MLAVTFALSSRSAGVYGTVWGQVRLNLDPESKGGGACQRAKQWVMRRPRLALRPEHMDRGSCTTAQPVSGRDASSVQRGAYSGYRDVHAAALFSRSFNSSHRYHAKSMTFHKEELPTALVKFKAYAFNRKKQYQTVC